MPESKLFDWWFVVVAVVVSFDTGDDVETVADVESLDNEPVLGTLSNCDDGRFSNFLLDEDSERIGVVILLPFSDDGGVLVLWPICETVLHKFPNGGYFERTLTVNSLVW